ncbi:MAG: hypothetical protein ACYSW6_08595, partial [Planctomycetota bacterium]
MRINIIGAGPGWEESKNAPGSNWGINDLIVARPVDVVIDVHPLLDYITKKKKPVRRSFNDIVRELAAVNLHDVPLYTIKPLKEVPTSMKYPLSNIRKKFGDYFGCGVDYAIALAL